MHCLSFFFVTATLFLSHNASQLRFPLYFTFSLSHPCYVFCSQWSHFTSFAMSLSHHSSLITATYWCTLALSIPSPNSPFMSSTISPCLPFRSLMLSFSFISFTHWCTVFPLFLSFPHSVHILSLFLSPTHCGTINTFYHLLVSLVLPLYLLLLLIAVLFLFHSQSLFPYNYFQSSIHALLPLYLCHSLTVHSPFSVFLTFPVTPCLAFSPSTCPHISLSMSLSIPPLISSYHCFITLYVISLVYSFHPFIHICLFSFIFSTHTMT